MSAEPIRRAKLHGGEVSECKYSSDMMRADRQMAFGPRSDQARGKAGLFAKQTAAIYEVQ